MNGRCGPRGSDANRGVASTADPGPGPGPGWGLGAGGWRTTCVCVHQQYGFIQPRDPDRVRLVPAQDKPEAAAPGRAPGDGGDPQADARDRAVRRGPLSRPNSSHLS